MSNELTGRVAAAEQGFRQIAEASRAGMHARGFFEMILSQIEEEAMEGHLAPARRALLAGMLVRLSRCIEVQPESHAGDVSAIARLADMLSIVAEAHRIPGHQEKEWIVSAGSHQENLIAKFKMLQSSLEEQVLLIERNEYTNDALNELYVLRTGEIEQAIMGANNDAMVRSVERDLVRRFALEIRTTTFAEHLTIAEPIWPTPPSVENIASGVFFSGLENTSMFLQQAVRKLQAGLDVMPKNSAHGNLPEYRWNQMHAAALCVFDMTHYSTDMCSDKERLKNLATVGYELGIALTLGRPVILLAHPSSTLPFDIGVTPVLLSGSSNDQAILMAALDNAIYKLQRTGAETSLIATRNQATALFSKHTNADVRLIIRHAFDKDRPDARRLHNVLYSIIEMIGGDALCLLTPTWPGGYPSKEHRRCFHVTNAELALADSIDDLVQSTCLSGKQHIEYLCSDNVPDTGNIRSIWNEICRATHIVVDLTGLSVTALIQLGMAHTLGRNVLLITRDDDLTAYPISLLHQAFHHYSMTQDGRLKLGRILERFINGHIDSENTDQTLDRNQLRARATSFALSCPEAQSIRAYIDQVLGLDEYSGGVPLKAHAASLGIDLDVNSIDDVRSYIDCVPACVEGLYQVASLREQLDVVQPILATIERYFTKANDLIADHHGLIGLLDDAYMSYAFIDRLNEEFVEKQGGPLLDMDIAAMNRDMKPLLTDTTFLTIDQHVQWTIEQNRMARQFKTSDKWLFGSLAAGVTWKVHGGMDRQASSNSGNAFDYLKAQIVG